MELVHLRNQAFYLNNVPNCRSKSKNLTDNIHHVTCKDCITSDEGIIMRRDRQLPPFEPKPPTTT